jgi:hypothetical protein
MSFAGSAHDRCRARVSHNAERSLRELRARCRGTRDDGAWNLGGLVGAIVAVVALVQSRRAAETAEVSLKLSRDLASHVSQQLEMQRVQYEHFEAERKRRPDLAVDVASGEFIVTDAISFLLVVSILNSGEREAEGVTLNIALPIGGRSSLVAARPDGSPMHGIAASSRVAASELDEEHDGLMDIYAFDLEVEANTRTVRNFLVVIDGPGVVQVRTPHSSMTETDVRRLNVDPSAA